MEIKLTKDSRPFITGLFIGKSPYPGHVHIALCSSAMRRVVDLPRRCDTVYAVFTKRKTAHEANSFTIIPQTGFGDSSLGRVKESNAYLLWGVRDTLGTAYDRGYRYVRFEYKDQD